MIANALHYISINIKNLFNHHFLTNRRYNVTDTIRIGVVRTCFDNRRPERFIKRIKKSRTKERDFSKQSECLDSEESSREDTEETTYTNKYQRTKVREVKTTVVHNGSDYIGTNPSHHSPTDTTGNSES